MEEKTTTQEAKVSNPKPTPLYRNRMLWALILWFLSHVLGGYVSRRFEIDREEASALVFLIPATLMMICDSCFKKRRMRLQ